MKKSFFFTVLILGLVLSFSLFVNQSANAEIQFDNTYQKIILPNGTTSNYRLTQNSTAITLETQEGSYVFTNTCTLYKYPKGLIGSQSPEFSDSYNVLASNTANGTSGWNPVGVINNAACSIYSVSNNTSVWITGTKTVPGAGSFSVTYMKSPQHDLKITMSATNNNPAWTNYHIGLRELLQGVNKTVTLGDTTYDLSEHNNTGLNRAFISTHNSQIMHLSKYGLFTMGLGWNHVNSITDVYHTNNPTLQIDYTYNTPILSPGNTITIDPAIVLDTSTTCNTDGGTTCAITIGSNSNRLLILTLNYGISPASSYSVSTVKIGTTPFTKLSNIIGKGSTEYAYTDVWYLKNPPTGAQTVTVTFGSTPANSAIGLISLYNVDQTTGINNATLATTALTSVSASPMSVTITPTKTGSWTLATGLGYNGMSAQSDTSLWTGTLDSGSAFRHSAQYKSAPTIGAGNAMTWANFGALANFGETLVAFEVMKSGTVPTAPTISKYNTLNNTAIQATWSAPTGASWYWANFTLSGGSTTHINTTATALTLNNYTAGSKYTVSIVAANATGKSSSSITKYNYTYNIAATAPIISSITSSQARLGWTNPGAGANLTGGFNIYKVTALGSNYTLVAQTSNNTNHYDLTSLLGNREYSAKLATRYAVGTNYTGASANTTSVSFYTLPNAPTGLVIAQTKPLIANLTWSAFSDNGTVLGYKIERSNNAGSSWSTIVSNTTNTKTNYNDTVPNAGTFYYRVSTIKYGGTSSPSSSAHRSIWNYFTVNAYHNDNVTAVYGSVFQSNSTSINNQFTLVSGSAVIPGISQNNNFTVKNALINFVVKKQYNYNTTSNHNINMSTYDYDVRCPYIQNFKAVELWTNSTEGHQITSFSTPNCISNNTIKWTVKFTANGNNINSFNTTVKAKILNNTYLTNGFLKYNKTMVSTAFSDPYITSANIPVGTGLQTRTLVLSLNLTLNPNFIANNFTIGNLTISGQNQQVIPIIVTRTDLNSTASNLIVTYPTGNNVNAVLTFQNSNQTLTYNNLPVSSTSLGKDSSMITFKNPNNDVVTAKFYDTSTSQNATYVMQNSPNTIPLIEQVKNFTNGTYGTHGQIANLDLVTLVIIILSMIGLNRTNEGLGVVLSVISIGAIAYFHLITFPMLMIPAIALIMLVAVGSTKKLPWS